MSLGGFGVLNILVGTSAYDMRIIFHIVLLWCCCLLCACGSKEDVDIVPGELYRLSTTREDGFARFEHSDNQWTAVFYMDEDELMAVKSTCRLKTGSELALVDNDGNEIPVMSYSRYEAPEFKDLPDTKTYTDSVYSVSVKKEVWYASAMGYWASYPDTGGTYLEIFNAKKDELDQGEKELDLTMDVYLPDDDKSCPRPLLVLIHGGAFFNGDKNDPGFPAWARYFASLGYVVATVNYRLGFRKSLASVNRAGFRGVQDVDAAIRYIIHNNDTYAVDPNRVFVAGTSAGGITALNVAFMRDENIPSDAKEEGSVKAINPDMQESYSIRAVGNMWGAVNDLSILDNAPTAVISFHSMGDPVVPFGKGHPFESIFINWLIFPTMYGSDEITAHIGYDRAALHSYNLPDKHTLHVGKDDDGNIVLDSLFYKIETQMRDFFSSRMLVSPALYLHKNHTQTFEVVSTDVDSLFWSVKGGVIQKQEGNSINVLMFPDEGSHSVTVCGKYKSGLTFRNEWKL